MAVSLRKGSGSGGGAPIVDTGSFASPQSVTSSISVPADARARIYLKGSGGPSVNPSLGNGTNTQELHIYGASDTDTVSLGSAVNLILSGSIVLKNGTYLLLHWIPNISKWIEVSRNEI